jgi:hypothetical protein
MRLHASGTALLAKRRTFLLSPAAARAPEGNPLS